MILSFQSTNGYRSKPEVNQRGGTNVYYSTPMATIKRPDVRQHQT